MRRDGKIEAKEALVQQRKANANEHSKRKLERVLREAQGPRQAFMYTLCAVANT